MHWTGVSFPYSETNIHHLQAQISQIFKMFPERFNYFIDFLDSMSDRGKALGSVLWKDLLINKQREAVEAPQARKGLFTVGQ